MMTNILLCGGAGTRLWPISRKSSPKQFVRLVDEVSLFKQAILRNSLVCGGTIAVTNDVHYFQARRQAEEACAENARFVVEPCGRGTAAAIALACMGLDAQDIVLVTPSDHRIRGQSAYAAVMTRAAELADEGYIVTFGVVPTRPETGFGYIQAAGEEVVAFREKPSLATAKKYLMAEDTYWNSGIFCFKAGVYLSELQKQSPVIYAASLAAFENAEGDAQTLRVRHEDMLAIPDNSIDRAVLEKSGLVRMLRAGFEWADLGSFDAVYDALEKDSQDNAVRGEITAVSSSGNLVMSSERQVMLVDVDGLVIVDTADALLVTRKGRAQSMSKAVSKLKEKTRDESCAVRKVQLGPGTSMALQPGRHIDEHWLVAAGKVVIGLNNGNAEMLLPRMTYIPQGIETEIACEGSEVALLVVTEFANPDKKQDGECPWLPSLAS